MRSFSHITGIINELDKSQEKYLDQAAVFMQKAVRSKLRKRKVSKKGDPPAQHSGNLIKGVKIAKRGRDIGNSYRLVGMAPPAHHAHLLEFGTVPRTVKNYRGKKGVSVGVGRVIARPFMRPAFEENAGNVEKILSGEWIK